MPVSPRTSLRFLLVGCLMSAGVALTAFPPAAAQPPAAGIRVEVAAEEESPVHTAKADRVGLVLPDDPVSWKRREIEEKLRDVTEVDFIDTPIAEAAAYLNDLHKVRIRIDENALGEQGIATDEPISVIISNVSLASALNHILTPLDLTYVIEDEVIQITTRDAAAERMSTQVYRVDGLLGEGTAVDGLAEVIEATCAPETWREHEGKGSLRVFGNCLVIYQSAAVHRRIRRLLETLAIAARE